MSRKRREHKKKTREDHIIQLIQILILVSLGLFFLGLLTSVGFVTFRV